LIHAGRSIAAACALSCAVASTVVMAAPPSGRDDAGRDHETPRAFYVLPALSGVKFGGAAGLEAAYRDVESSTIRFGATVPVLYMRTTRGADHDWQFDAAFDVNRARCATRRIADDSLDTIITNAVAKRLPTLFVLNGGIWADASCDSPQWDLNDHLEQDATNCQWSQGNEVFADDYLRGLTGSIDSPQLARSLTYNVHAREVRRYKRRNLQAAATRIARFAAEHPGLFVGVVLDADTYMNPFFNGEQWFDYNPGTVRQFREWLQGTGPYAASEARREPDLRAYSRARPLTLEDVNRLAGRQWSSWDDVDPPRRFPGSPRDALVPGATPYWDDPWYNVWDVFRKHLVDLHYDELSRWTHEAGIARDRIFSAQGFAAPYGRNRPFALRVASTGQNYDSAGMSLEGAKPADGHLGAILYGKAAENDIPTENGRSLFWNFAHVDAGWGIVEFSVTELNRPEDVAGYARAYRAFRDVFNFDGRFVVPMAWNGSRGSERGQPGYRPHTAWRETEGENAMRDFARSHAGVPRGSRVWTFGTARLASDDGWGATGADTRAQPGRLVLLPHASRVVLTSPRAQMLRPSAHRRLRIEAEVWPRLRSVTAAVRVEGRDEWVHVSGHAWRVHGKALEARLTWPRMPVSGSELRIELETTERVPIELSRILLTR
jgi:hypothetical protein